MGLLDDQLSDGETLRNNIPDEFMLSWKEMHLVWDDIGVFGENRVIRITAVWKLLHNLLVELIDEDKTRKDNILRSITKYSKKIKLLCKELGMPPFQVESNSSSSMFIREKNMKKKASELQDEKEKRLNELASLLVEEKHLCALLALPPSSISPSAVPSLSQISDLKRNIEMMQSEKSRRQSEFFELKNEIVECAERLHFQAGNSFEQQLLNENRILLSAKDMESLRRLHSELKEQSLCCAAEADSLVQNLRKLWARLNFDVKVGEKFVNENYGLNAASRGKMQREVNRLQGLRKESIQTEAEILKEQLESWLDKCYFNKFSFQEYLEAEILNEEVMDLLVNKLNELKEYYSKNQEMLELIDKRQKLWNEFLVMEQKASDSTRYANRGCNLLKEEQARKKLARKLPVLEEEINEKIKEWENKSNCQFLVRGKKFMDFVEEGWDNFHREKEDEKTLRQQKKSQLTREEMKFGSKPIAAKTPVKRNLTSSSSKSSVKLKKFNEALSPVMSAHTPPLHGRGWAAAAAHKSKTNLSPATRSSARTPQDPVGTLHDSAGTPQDSAGNHHRTLARVGSKGKIGHKTKTPLHSKNSQHSGSALRSTRNLSLSDTVVCSPKLDAVADVGRYNEFARGISKLPGENLRSSVVPKNAVYF